MSSWRTVHRCGVFLAPALPVQETGTGTSRTGTEPVFLRYHSGMSVHSPSGVAGWVKYDVPETPKPPVQEGQGENKLRIVAVHPVPFTSIKNDKVLFYFVFESRPDVHNSRWLAVRTMSVWFNETTGKFENAMLSGVRCMLEFPITIQVISVHGCFQVGQIVLGDAKITAETTTYLFSDICAKMIYGHSRASAIPLPLEGWTDGIFVSGYPGHQKYIDQVFEERTSFSEAQRMMTLLFGPQSKRKGKDLVKLELKKDNGGTNIAMNDGSVFRTAKITSHAQAMALLTIDKIASPCGQYLYCTEGKYYDKSEPKSPEETFWVKRFGTV